MIMLNSTADAKSLVDVSASVTPEIVCDIPYNSDMICYVMLCYVMICNVML